MKKNLRSPGLSDQGGLSLLEIIVALGLISLVLLFSTQTLVTIIRTNGFSQDRTGALALAQGKMEALLSRPVSDLKGEVEGQITSGNLPLVYRRETTIDRGGPSGCALVTVKVSWPSASGQNPHQLELATLIAE